MEIYDGTKIRDAFILTADIIIRVDGDKIILIKRAKDPYMDKYALPGGAVDHTDTSIKHACLREADEELGLSGVDLEDLEYICHLDRKNRDPRNGRWISSVYLVDISEEKSGVLVANSDAKSFELVPICDITPDMMGFDHWDAIQKI